MNRAALIFGLLILTGCKQSPEQVAQVVCQEALKQAAKNPSSAEIPPGIVEPLSFVTDGTGYSVTWGHGKGLRFQNGFGAMLDSTAMCIVRDGKVTRLGIDEKMVI